LAIDDPVDAAVSRLDAEERSTSPLRRFVPAFFKLSELIPGAWGTGGIEVALGREEADRRDYLFDVIISEVKRLGLELDKIKDRWNADFAPMVLDALQKAEKTRSRDRIERMGRIVAAYFGGTTLLTADDAEELLRVSMDLGENDIKVLVRLVDLQGDKFNPDLGMVPRGLAIKAWSSAIAKQAGSRSALAESINMSDGELYGACAKLQAYGLLLQVDRDEAKLPATVVPYAVLARGITYVQALMGASLGQTISTS
jgi:hypothetical protein